MDGFCNQNADQLGSLAGPSLLTVYVGVVDCAPASLPPASSSLTHELGRKPQGHLGMSRGDGRGACERTESVCCLLVLNSVTSKSLHRSGYAVHGPRGCVFGVCVLGVCVQVCVRTFSGL
jgi:hypothetical protein